jgi:hypothetical protein
MAIALGTALAIGAVASAAGGGVKSVIQAKGAKKAAEQQQKGTREATAYQREGLGQIGQLYSPYINSGAGAMGTLGRLTTPPRGTQFASRGPGNAMPQPTSPYGQNPDAYGARTAQPRMGGGGGYRPGGPSPGDGENGLAGMGDYGSPRRFAGFGGFGGFGRNGGYGPEPGSPENPIPMAKGGTVTVNKPTTFLAGEAGPERVNVKPLQRPMVPRPAAVPRPMAPRPAAVPRPMPAQAQGQALGRQGLAPGSVRANAARQQAEMQQRQMQMQAREQEAQAAAGAPMQDPRSAEEFAAHRAAGEAAGQDMGWMNQRQGGFGGNTGIAGGRGMGELVPEQYGAMGPNAGGPWGNMIQAGAQMGSAMAQPMQPLPGGQEGWAGSAPQGQYIDPRQAQMGQQQQQGMMQRKMAMAQQKQAQMAQQRQMMQQRAQMMYGQQG